MKTSSLFFRRVVIEMLFVASVAPSAAAENEVVILSPDDLAMIAVAPDDVEWVDLAGTKIRNVDLQYVVRLRNLRKLYLDRTSNIMSKGFAGIGRLDKLQTLSLFDLPIDDSVAEHFKGFRSYPTTDLVVSPVSRPY